MALGGGSAIDTAKAASIVVACGGTVEQYEGENKSSKPGLPIVAVNTTAGRHRGGAFQKRQPAHGQGCLLGHAGNRAKPAPGPLPTVRMKPPANDIFIHMDSKNTDYQPETVECRMKYAKVFHAKRHSVVWGGVSQVKADLVLLKTAVAHGPYQHYHLISGVDLRIQTQEDIRAFFEANPDVEFVHFDPHPFSPFNGVINGILLSGQKLLKIKRNQDVHFTKGSNWFSCTDGFARYLLTKKSGSCRCWTRPFARTSSLCRH